MNAGNAICLSTVHESPWCLRRSPAHFAQLTSWRQPSLYNFVQMASGKLGAVRARIELRQANGDPHQQRWRLPCDETTDLAHPDVVDDQIIVQGIDYRTTPVHAAVKAWPLEAEFDRYRCEVAFIMSALERYPAQRNQGRRQDSMCFRLPKVKPAAIDLGKAGQYKYSAEDTDQQANKSPFACCCRWLVRCFHEVRPLEPPTA